MDWSLQLGLKRKNETSLSQWLFVRVKNKGVSLQVRIMYLDGIVLARKKTKEAAWSWWDADVQRGTVTVL